MTNTLKMYAGDTTIPAEELAYLQGLFSELAGKVAEVNGIVARLFNTGEMVAQECTFTISYSAPFPPEQVNYEAGPEAGPPTSIKVHLHYADGTSVCLQDPPGIGYAC